MSCLIAPSRDTSDELFGQFLFTDVPQRTLERKRSRSPSTFFDSSTSPIQRRVIEIPARLEEDNERWDGLS